MARLKAARKTGARFEKMVDDRMTEQFYRVGVLFGGRSSEHEVSLASAKNVMDALREAGHEVVPIGITPQGASYVFAALKTQTELAGACFSPDGRTLYVNAYSPAATLAITGPWG